MSSPATPLLIGGTREEHEINVTASHSPPNFSRHTTWFGSHRTSPSTHHGFRKTQHSLNLSSLPDTNYKRIRRKPSLTNLYGTVIVSSTSSPAEQRVPSSHRFTPQPHLPSTSPSASSTPQQEHEVESPSLSSTVDTIESSPTQTPYHGRRTFDQQTGASEDIGVGEVISTKRKFLPFRAAKRLPQRGGSGDGTWFVYAAIFDGGAAPYGTNVEEGLEGLEETVTSEVQEEFRPTKEKSVKFAEVDSESVHGRVTEEVPGSALGQKDTAADSTFTLSKFQFPSPPVSTWTGTFGHLKEQTPPTSPTTLHYRGASFDVVNPHASLLLGTKDFETPGEIDGLLDDYFSRPSPRTPKRRTMEDKKLQPDSTSSENSGRHFRTLYEDADSARRNIMRLPDAPSHDPGTSQKRDSDSPLADNNTETSDRDEHVEETPYIPRSHIDGGLAQTVERTSSEYPHSSFSEPFDLQISEDGGDHRLVNIDAVIDTIDHAAVETSAHDSAQRSAVYEEGAYAQATTTEADADSTVGHIYRQYEYTNVPLTPQGTGQSYETVAPSRYGSVEHGRPAQAALAQQHAVSTGSFYLSHGYRYSENGGECYFFRHEDDHPMSPMRLNNSHGFPEPPPPLFGSRAQHALLPYQAESSDVPTSEQTYGQTSDLLQITPRQLPAARLLHAKERTEHYGYSSARGTHYAPAEENENTPPLKKGGIPVQWSDADLPFDRRSYTRDRDYPERALIRSSSHYPEDDGDWEDTQASESRANLLYGPNRMSILSYADTSDCGSTHRLSTLAPQGQPTTHDYPDHDGQGTSRRFNNKAHRVLMNAPNDRTEFAEMANPAKRADQLIMKKLERDYVLTMHAKDIRTFSPDEIEEHKADAAELESIREEMPSTVQYATAQAVKKFQEQQSIAQTQYSTKVPVKLTRPKRAFHPQDSFERVAQLSLRRDNQSMHSETRGLLHGSESPSGHGLQYSETTGTFRTTRDGASPVSGYRGYVSHGWAPLSSMSHLISGALRNATPASTIRTANADEYELNSLRPNRPAVRSQTSLRPINVGGSATSATYGPLTDGQLMEAEPSWGNEGRMKRSGLHIRLPVRIEDQPRLLSVEDGRHAQMLNEQECLSNMYFVRCAYFPPLALAFGLGLFDGFIKKKTNGRVTEMRSRDKYWAKYAAFPLAMMFYGIVAIVTTLIVLGAIGSL